MYYYTALVCLASVTFYGWLGFRVGKARIAFNIPAPATSGDPTFERMYRVQMNTLEWLPIHLVALWAFAFYVSDIGAAMLGLIWIAGRLVYSRAYLADPSSRTKGFVIQLAATAVLGLGAIADIFARIVLGD